MNILFSINAKFIDLTKTCIRSIIRFDKNIDFYILHHDLNQKHMDDLRRSFLECTFHFIEVKEEEFKGFPISSRYPLEIYYRLFASDLLPKTLDRILYLDVDIVVIQSLRELYNMDFERNLYIASSHVNERMTHLNAKRLGLKEDVPYINTGVLLMNLELLRKQLNKQDILNYVNAYKKNLVLFDQELRDRLADRDRELLTANFQLSQQAQSANIISTLQPTPKPAYITCSPYYAYNNGCGCNGYNNL